MTTRSQASSNPLLTNYARGLGQDMSASLAEFFAPTVPVAASIGRFSKFDDKNQFQVYDADRALGGARKRIAFAKTTGSYDCQPKGLEIPIDDSERSAAGDDQAALEQDKTRTLMTVAQLSREAAVFALAAQVSAVATIGVWSNSSNDPVAEIDGQIEAIALNTGMMPNRMVIGLGAWRVIRNHPKVLARFPGAALIGVTTEQFASLLMNPSIQIKVGVLSKDTAKFGAAKSAVNLVGASVYLFIASQSPTQYDPSWFKTFATRGNGVGAVKVYRDETCGSDVVAVDWEVDVQQVSTACGVRIAVS